ncbi:YdcF family protein [Thermodesulfobacteriota bacterium]
MPLFLTKLLPQLIYPLSLCIFMAIFSGVVVLRRKKTGVALLFLSIGLLWASSTSVVSSYLTRSLEQQFHPVPIKQSGKADAIVVLGGGIGRMEPPATEIDLSGSADRVLHGARLYRAGKAPLVIASGGAIPWMGSKKPESTVMSRLLQEWGVPVSAIIVEPESRNTHQNAVNTKKILKVRGIDKVFLVTSAMHMQRALSTFKAAGINAIPSPTDYHSTAREKYTVLDFLPNAEALVGTTLAMKEYLGWLVYFLQGYI